MEKVVKIADGRGITQPEQTRALLLHCAGIAVQDIFFTLAEEEGTNAYGKTVKSQILRQYQSYCVNLLGKVLCLNGQKT